MFGRKILPHSTGGSYVNYLSAGEDVHSAYHDARFQRLAAIKAQYDPRIYSLQSKHSACEG